MQLELMKQRAGTMFRQMAEKHAREVSDMERAHEATLRAMEARRYVQRRATLPSRCATLLCCIVHTDLLALLHTFSMHVLVETSPSWTRRWRSS